MAKFRITKTKCGTVMIERLCNVGPRWFKWPLKKHFLVTGVINLYHFPSSVAKALRALTKTNTHKGIYYFKVANVLAHTVYEIDSDFNSNEE